MNVKWVKIDAWHALDYASFALYSDDNKVVITVCGLAEDASDPSSIRDTLPAEASCENCLRILARETDGDVRVP